MKMNLQCDCGCRLRAIITKVDIKEQEMTIVVTPCRNCIDHSWQGGRDEAIEDADKLKERIAP